VVTDVEVGERRTVVEPHIVRAAVTEFPIEPVADARRPARMFSSAISARGWGALR